MALKQNSSKICVLIPRRQGKCNTEKEHIMLTQSSVNIPLCLVLKEVGAN